MEIFDQTRVRITYHMPTTETDERHAGAEGVTLLNLPHTTRNDPEQKEAETEAKCLATSGIRHGLVTTKRQRRRCQKRYLPLPPQQSCVK